MKGGMHSSVQYSEAGKSLPLFAHAVFDISLCRYMRHARGL